MTTMAMVTKRLSGVNSQQPDMEKMADTLQTVIKHTDNNSMVYAETGVKGSLLIDLSEVNAANTISITARDGANSLTADKLNELTNNMNKRLGTNMTINTNNNDTVKISASDKVPTSAPTAGIWQHPAQQSSAAPTTSAPKKAPKHKM